MELNNFTGIILAVVVFVTIGFGHVFVRKANYHYGTKLGIPLYIIGGIMLIYSLFVERDLFSAILGITAITIIWDGLEMYRQEKRIEKGHAPRNPNRVHDFDKK